MLGDDLALNAQQVNGIKEEVTHAYLLVHTGHQLWAPARSANVEANIKAVHQAVRVVAGASDEAFETDKLEGFFRQQGQAWPVTLLPGIDHIGLTLNASAVNAIVTAVDTM